jgi:hypothetical protein
MAEPDKADRQITPALLKSLLTAPFDLAAWAEVMGEDCHLRIANGPPAVGRDASLRQLSGFLHRIRGFGGSFCEVWRQREVMVTETDVIFAEPQGHLACVPCVIVIRTTRGLVRDLRFYLDPTPIP